MNDCVGLCLKSLSLDVSFTPGFSPVMKHTRRRRTVLTVYSSSVNSEAVELQNTSTVEMAKPLKRFPYFLRRRHRAEARC